MMKEILRNGVLNSEFQAPDVFATYSGGIMSEGSLRALHKKTEENKNGKATNVSD